MLKEKEIEKKEIKEDESGYYYKLFQEALDLHKEYFDSYIELAAYYELQQDKLNTSSVKPWVYQINTPYATDAVNLRVASLQSSDYTGELEPLSPDDIDNVMKINGVYKEFWKEMNMDKTINDAILNAAVLREAYAHIIFDDEDIHGGTNRKNKGRLKAYFIDPASVHIDPKSFSLKESDYICVSERITKKKAEHQYKDFDFDKLKQGNSPEEMGEIFVGNDYTTNQEGKVLNKITIYEKDGKDIYKVVLLERVIVEEKKKLDIKVYPIAQLRWQKRLKTPYGTSLMEMLLPLQKVVNEIESANANANMQYSSPSYVLSEDSGIDPEELALNAGAPAAVYVTASGYDIDKVIKPLIPNRGIDQGLVLTKQELERSIYNLAGITEEFKGTLGTAGNTSGGANLVAERSKVIENRIITNIEEFVEDLTRIIVEYASQAYAGDKVYSRGEKQTNGQFNFKSFDMPEEAPDVEYNFNIELNIKSQYSKEQQKIAIKELFEIERQYDTGDVKVLNVMDIIKSLNIPQGDELTDRYANLMKMDAQQRAQIVTEMVTTAQEFGVDAQLLSEALSEILLNKRETPMVDMFLQTVEKLQMQQQQAQQSVQNAIMGNELDAQMEMQNPENAI
jgi:hypothetical protein